MGASRKHLDLPLVEVGILLTPLPALPEAQSPLL